MADRVYTLACPFGGIGGGALGFQSAEVRLLGALGRFHVLGSVDFDEGACTDFERIVDAPALRADVATLTAADVRRFYGERAPDVVFMSPPCKGASGLLSAKRARTAKYREMNRFALRWTELMLEAWAEPPALVLLENVPRLRKRAAGMLRRLRSLLRRAGYVLTDGYHDCGELGGLAQVRRRYLLVARHPRRCPPLLYQPPTKRVRACGEVLSELPMPLTPEAAPWGRMHEMPRISWLNWVRLALIPAGGDWRDLEGVLQDGQARREVFRRHQVQRWDEPSGTVAGSGSNGPGAVADPRIRVEACKPHAHHNKYTVADWDDPARTVIGATRPGSGAPSVADPRVRHAYDHGYGILRWVEPSSTVAGGSHVGQGAYSVADIRFPGEYRAGTYGVLRWDEAAGTITGNARVDNGRFGISDPRKPPESPLVIIAADGTWHRPLTTLELAALQGLPTTVKGEPLVLSGRSASAWRERIGNCVPPPAAEAIARRMLCALLEADLGGFSLRSDGAVWVRRELMEVAHA